MCIVCCVCVCWQGGWLGTVPCWLGSCSDTESDATRENRQVLCTGSKPRDMLPKHRHHHEHRCTFVHLWTLVCAQSYSTVHYRHQFKHTHTNSTMQKSFLGWALDSRLINHCLIWNGLHYNFCQDIVKPGYFLPWPSEPAPHPLSVLSLPFVPRLDCQSQQSHSLQGPKHTSYDNEIRIPQDNRTDT